MRAVVREYIDWFAPHQFADGKVPCCVDHRGADPVVENDSHGELVYLIAQYYRYTHDRDWLRSMWPHVAAAVKLHERAARKGTPSGERDAVATRVLRTDAAIDQPRRLFRPARLLLLGRLLDGWPVTRAP